MHMRKCQHFAVRVFVAVAAANLAIPFSLLFCCHVGYCAQATDELGHPGCSPARVSVRPAPTADERHRNVKLCESPHGSAIGTKYRLHRERAVQNRAKDRHDQFSPFTDRVPGWIADVDVTVHGLYPLIHTIATPGRCIEFSRLIL
jgi:hypothetical protein